MTQITLPEVGMTAVNGLVPMKHQVINKHHADSTVTSAQGIYQHYNDVIMTAMAYQIIGVSIFYSTVCSGANQRKHQSYASLASVRGIHWWPVNSPHKGPVTRKLFPFDDVIRSKRMPFESFERDGFGESIGLYHYEHTALDAQVFEDLHCYRVVMMLKTHHFREFLG